MRNWRPPMHPLALCQQVKTSLNGTTKNTLPKSFKSCTQFNSIKHNILNLSMSLSMFSPPLHINKHFNTKSHFRLWKPCLSPTKSLHTMNIWLTCEKKDTHKIKILTFKIKLNKTSIVTQGNHQVVTFKPSSTPCHIQVNTTSLMVPPPKNSFLNCVPNQRNPLCYIHETFSLCIHCPSSNFCWSN